MSAQGRTGRKRPTDYESEQIRQIAAWKSVPPHPLTELWGMIALPAAKVLRLVIPERLARSGIEKADDLADHLADRENIKRQAGVRDLADLRDRPLEDCDRMASKVGLAARAIATAEGAATGVGGVWTTLLDIPLLFTLALRTVRKIGHCYGYALDDRQGRRFVIGTLVTALSGSLEVRRQRLKQLRELENMLADEAQEELGEQEVLSLLFQLEVFAEVPGLGAASGAVLNVALMNRVVAASKKIFQERWLRDAGKVEEIEPAEAPAHTLAGGLSGALVRLTYSGCYSVGYGAAIPVYTAAALFGPMNNALNRGIRDGAATESSKPRRRSARALPAPA